MECGQNVNYNITVKNNQDTDTAPYFPTDDDLPAANLFLVDAIPTGTVFQSLTAPSGWSCTTPAVGGTGLVLCTAASLGVGASAQFTLTVAVIVRHRTVRRS